MGVYAKLLNKTKDEVLTKISYTFYKEQKSEFINKIPTDITKPNKTTQINNFTQTALLDSSIDGYIAKGEVFINNFVTGIEDDLYSQYEEDLEETKINCHNKIDGIKEVYENKNKESYWKGVSQSVVGSFMMILITGAIIFFSWAKDFSFNEAISAVSKNHKSIEKQIEIKEEVK